MDEFVSDGKDDELSICEERLQNRSEPADYKQVVDLIEVFLSSSVYMRREILEFSLGARRSFFFLRQKGRPRALPKSMEMATSCWRNNEEILTSSQLSQQLVDLV